MDNFCYIVFCKQSESLIQNAAVCIIVEGDLINMSKKKCDHNICYYNNIKYLFSSRHIDIWISLKNIILFSVIFIFLIQKLNSLIFSLKLNKVYVVSLSGILNHTQPNFIFKIKHWNSNVSSMQDQDLIICFTIVLKNLTTFAEKAVEVINKGCQ